jgi:hypothetical protein
MMARGLLAVIREAWRLGVFTPSEATVNLIDHILLGLVV